MTHHATQDDAPDALEVASKSPPPSRPAAIELASAILIVGGAISLVGALSAALGTSTGNDPFVGLTMALAIGSVVVGLLIRFGRSWIVAVNYVAVLGFLDLLASSASPLALMLGLADIVVVVILLIYKPWYDAAAARRSSRGARTAQPFTPPTARPPTR